jgi:argininosuccinate lyase
MKHRMWGGAFSEGPDELAWKFGASLESDAALMQEEVDVSIAHVAMLAACGIIPAEQGEAMEKALAEMADGAWLEGADAEDIHAAVEAELIRRVGDIGGSVGTARSRNDQIATVSRLWTARRCHEIDSVIEKLQRRIVALAKSYADAPMPGRTHMQPAQPITLGYQLLAYFWMLARDRKRFSAARELALAFCPMGSGAIAGTSLPIDRAQTATALGFAAPSPSAIDSVSDRDYVGDTLHACATLMQHLSRLAQELVLWSTDGSVRISEGFATGSSLMPQKRNPDVAELIRGRASQPIGDWVSFMAMLKGQPLAYNRDMQDDKPPLYNSVRIALQSATLLDPMLGGAEFNVRQMEEGAGKGGSVATAIAEELVRRGIPFREAHERAGEAVRKAEASGRDLCELSLPELANLLPGATEQLHRQLSVRGNTELRDSYGAPARIAEQIAAAESELADNRL